MIKAYYLILIFFLGINACGFAIHLKHVKMEENLISNVTKTIEVKDCRTIWLLYGLFPNTTNLLNKLYQKSKTTKFNNLTIEFEQTAFPVYPNQYAYGFYPSCAPVLPPIEKKCIIIRGEPIYDKDKTDTKF